MKKQVESSSTCPACHGSASFYFSAQDTNRNISDHNFAYFRCAACHYIFLDPIPQDLGRFYPEDYYGAPPESVKALEGAARIVEGYKIDLIKEHIKSGRMLEIGPSMGGFAVLAQSEGYDVETIEMNSTCSDFLNQVANIKTIHAKDEISALAQIEPVDAIAMWHVIEHLQNPFELLRAVNQKLKEGGVLVVAAPNPDALQFRLLRSRWVHVDAPRHVCLIPLKLLRKKLEGLGFEVICETTTDRGGLGWNQFGWEYSLANRFTSPRARRWAQRLGRLISAVARPFEKGQRGSAYTVIARKPILEKKVERPRFYHEEIDARLI